MKSTSKAHIALFLVTVIWGMTFPLIKDAVANISPLWFVTLRTAVAALLFSPLLWFYRKHLSKKMWWAALWLGVFQSGSYLTQSIGLQTISSANSAFITAFSVVLVPFIAFALRINKPTRFDMVASLLCLLGIFILTGASFKAISIGDLWTLLSALSYALFVVQLQRISQWSPNPFALAATQMVFSVPLPVFASLNSPWSMHLNLITVAAIIFCALLATGLVFILQARYQKDTTVNKAVLIYAFEPIFATIFAFLLNHEAISLTTAVGGVLVVSGFLLSEFVSRKSTKHVLKEKRV